MRVCGHGGDCVAMCEDIGLHFGVITEPFRTNYGRDPMMREILQALKAAGCVRRKSVELRQPADVAFVKWSNKPQHLGIISYDDRIIHGYESRPGTGRYIETKIGQRILEGLCSVWAIPGMEG